MKSWLGLDLSFSGTGFFLLREDDSNKKQEIKTDPKTFSNLVRRTKWIAESILELLKDEDVALVLMEDCYAGGGFHARTGLILSALGTMVRDRLMANGYRYITAAPTQIKKFETGNGTAGKELMLKSVFKNHHVDVTSNNVADACAMAYFCKAFYNWKIEGYTDFFKYQLDVLKKMDQEIQEPYEK